MQDKKTKYIKVRMTEEEVKKFKEKAADYDSVSHYVRCAIEEYSNINAKQRLELINELGTFYRKYWDELSWAGGNLNQAVKRANELAVAGKLVPYYIDKVLLPQIQTTQKTLSEIKRALDAVTDKAIKLGLIRMKK